jgi:predicted metal-dependent hydrolase
MEEKPTLADLEALAVLICDKLGIARIPKINIKNAKRGFAHSHKGHFSIPRWTWKHGEMFVIHYCIHELIHFVDGDLDHGPRFAQLEDEMNALFDIRIERMRVYPARVYHNNKVLYTHPRVTRRLAKMFPPWLSQPL